MQKININDASEHLSEVIEAVTNGEEIVITKGEQPLVILKPILQVKKRWTAKIGSAKGLVTISDDFDEPLDDFKDRM